MMQNAFNKTLMQLLQRIASLKGTCVPVFVYVTTAVVTAIANLAMVEQAIAQLKLLKVCKHYIH